MLQWTRDNLNLQGKLQKSSSYREFKANNQEYGNKQMTGMGRECNYHAHFKGNNRYIDTFLKKELKQQSLNNIQGWTLSLNWTDKEVQTNNARLF